MTTPPTPDVDELPGPDAERPDLRNPACASRMVLDRIADRWSILILLSLRSGPLRFSALRDAVGGITPKVLTATLRALVRDGLITRTDHHQQPPRVDYALTPLGRQLLVPVAAIAGWAEEHVPDIVAARAAHDAESLRTTDEGSLDHLRA